MKVKDIMTANPKACSPTSSLADAARFMWDSDCGILPVVTDGGKVVGLITDRDICMAAAINNRNLENIAVEDVVTGEVYSCEPQDDLRTVLETMRDKRVRRLPVIEEEEKTLIGMLSLNDIVRQIHDAKPGKDIGYRDVMATFKGICERRAPKEQVLAAKA